MKKLILAFIFLLLPTLARAQFVSVPSQASTAYEGSHAWTGGLKLENLCVTWHTAAARWLMIFDAAAVPSNGAVTPEWCQPLLNSGSTADLGTCFYWGLVPVWNRNGIVTVVSTNSAGCSTLTADGSNDWFSGVQVLP